MIYVKVYIYIVNYIDMRRINENDISRIIKKVLRESPSQTDSFGDCFKKAGIPTPKSCKTTMKDINLWMTPTCVKDIGVYMLNPYNLSKIGKLYACLGKEAMNSIQAMDMDSGDKI
jgi:hypothetical protein